jgi:hypothetical protein
MSFPSLSLALQKLPSTDEGPGTQVPRAFPWVIIQPADSQARPAPASSETQVSVA